MEARESKSPPLTGPAAAGLAAALVLALAGCGSGSGKPEAPRPPAPAGEPLVAALGDSITAGSPLWDPNPGVRERAGTGVDPESQYEYWAQLRLRGRAEFRNCGVFGERTDEIAARLDKCAKGARYLVIQGGINDIAQGRSVDDAARSLRGIVLRGKALGLRVGMVDVLPWNNGRRLPGASAAILELNRRIKAIGRDEHIPVLPFYKTLDDPRHPGAMPARLTIDGDHPSVAGYRRLGRIFRLP